MESKARQIHLKAEEEREKEEFLKALQFLDEATFLYQEEGDYSGMAEVQSSRFLTLRHLYEETGDKNYLVLAGYAARAGVDIARKSAKPEALAIPLYNYAKSKQDLGDYQEAVEIYKEALANMVKNPPKEHNRSSVVDDMTVHMSVCEYLAGDKSALPRAEKALIELQNDEESNKYNQDVWVSGGYMDIAKMLIDDDPKRAREYLEEARKIIDSNPDLIIRRKQWERLKSKIT